MPRVECSQCRYDLSQHELRERCPECGADVARVFAEDPWWSGQRQVELRRGLYFLPCGIVLLLVMLWFPTTFIPYSKSPEEATGLCIVAACLAVLQQAFWLSGLWLVTRYKHIRLEKPRHLVWTGAAGLVVAQALLAVSAALFGLPDLQAVLFMFSILTLFLGVGCVAAWMAQVSRMMKLRRYAGQFMVITAVLLGLPGLALLFDFVYLVMTGYGILALGWGFILSVIFCLPAMVWLLIVLLALGRMLHQENRALGLVR